MTGSRGGSSSEAAPDMANGTRVTRTKAGRGARAHDRAEAEAIPIMVSTLPAFELAGKLYQAGIRGRS